MTLVRGGTVFDGSTPEGAVHDVLLADGRVAEVGPRLRAGGARVIDAADAWVMPGFVDAHSHCDLSVLTGSAMELRARAGVTTEIVGQDGLGFAPVDSAAGEIMAEVLAPIVGESDPSTWEGISAYLREVDLGSYARVATLIPHGALRARIAGRADRPLDAGECCKLGELVCAAAADGAVGLSTGLSYPPAIWSQTEEIVVAASALPPGRPYVTHVRDYGARFDAALDEALAVGVGSGRPVHLSHFHVSGPGRDGQAGAYLDRLGRAAGSGLSLSWDSYPYVHACTFLGTVLPPRYQAMSSRRLLGLLSEPAGAAAVAADVDAAGPGATVAVDWDRLLLAGLEQTPLAAWSGRSVGAVAADEHRTPGQVVVEVVRRLAGHACVLVEQGYPANIVEIANQPSQVVGSDGIPGCGVPHPRAAGSFLRFLRWARDGVLGVSVGEMISKMTARTAALFGLDVGRLVPGASADLLIVDPEAITDGPDTGAFQPTAVRYSFLAGELQLDDGRWLARRLPNLALRGTRS
jgi:N-acyl-D-amino-acid deacylase